MSAVLEEVIVPKQKKVAIVGGAPGTQMLAPFGQDEWDIWVLGNQLSDYDGKRVDAVFEIHDDLSDKPDGYVEWVLKHSPQLIVGDNFPALDDKIEIYPRDEVNALLGGGENLSSSPAYMIGLAILRGYTEIGIYGVDMGVDDHEYFKQRPYMYAWIGYAKAKGIKVTIPEKCPLFSETYDEGRDWGVSKLAGSAPFNTENFEEMAQQHRDRVEEIDKMIADLNANRNAHRGSMQVFEQLARIARIMKEGTKVEKLTDVTRLNTI
ncbi:MAG: hypothetical protein KJO69_05445 [Gammaproteobacteria bacterium]|nr:hypothetical protein [Gammaproteobacteria bacterium]